MKPTIDNTSKNPPSGKSKLFVGIAKTFEFFNRFVPTIENKSEGIYIYGVDNLLPNNNLRIINDCGVAKRCVRKKARYIQGDGFADKNAAEFKVNRKQTADHLLRTISSYASYFEGFALSISRHADLKIAEVKSIPFQCVRRKIDGTLEYNPTKGQSFVKDKTTVHPEFNPRITPEEFKKNLVTYKNQPEIMYVFEETADNPHYPVPDYYAGIEDIQTCSEISKMDLELTENGFMPSAILTTNEIDDVNKGDDGKTAYETFTDEMNKFTGKKKTYNPNLYSSRAREQGDIPLNEGKSGRFKLLHVMVSAMAEAPKLEKYDAKSILEASNEKRNVIGREVCGLIGVHPIMVGFSDAAILGNQQALANVIMDLNHYINPIQRMITEAFQSLYPDIEEWTISQFSPVIPPEVWAIMTMEEKRNSYGLADIEVIEPEKATSTSKNGSENALDN